MPDPTPAAIRCVDAAPLTEAAYAPYGQVIEAHADPTAGRVVNLGTARRRDHLCALENLRGDRAHGNLSVFRCQPAAARPVPIAVLEKHPLSTQVFVPMNAQRYLVIVALGGDRPDLSTLAAFIATGRQAISYHPGVWHHPMIALDAEIDFACLVWEDGSPDDCIVDPLTDARLAVQLDDAR